MDLHKLTRLLFKVYLLHPPQFLQSLEMLPRLFRGLRQIIVVQRLPITSLNIPLILEQIGAPSPMEPAQQSLRM
jgi:hypothetical protein